MRNDSYTNDEDLADDLSVLVEGAEGTGNEALVAEATEAHQAFLDGNVETTGRKLEALRSSVPTTICRDKASGHV